MNNINFSDGKLSISMSDIITFVYIKNDSDISYIGSTINNIVNTMLTVENIIIKNEETHVELTITSITKKIILIPIKSDNLIHYLMQQIKCINENFNKINNIVDNAVRIDCTVDSNILIGSKCLEFIFTKEPKISTSHINHTVIYFDISHMTIINEQVSLVKSDTLIVSCDSSENIMFSWENLPKTIKYVVINNKNICDSLLKNIDNIDIDVLEIEFKNFIIDEHILDIIVLKWPDITFKYNGKKFNYEKLNI